MRKYEFHIRSNKKGLDCNLYYLSLFVALCIPDICAALEYETGDNTGEIGKKHKEWIEEYIVKARPDKYGERLSPDHIWQFRCSLLHQGITKHKKTEYKKILFFEPGADTGVQGLHCCIIGADTEDKSLMIDVQQFCDDIISDAKTWLEKNRLNENYINNYEKLIKRHPNRVSPVFGAPVIA